MSVASVRMSDEEKELFTSYCRLHGITISEAFKHALLQNIEDEFDLADFEAALAAYKKNPKTHTIEELRKAYDL